MKALYFIGLVIPDFLSAEIQQIKIGFSKKYKTRHGVNTIPHITIEPPFRATEPEIQITRDKVSLAAKDIGPFEISLDGYGHFGKKVLFINVLNSSMLERVYAKIRGISETDREAEKKGFHPHVTIAHQDLAAMDFDRAWAEFRDKRFRYGFKSESISMLVHKDGSWEVDSSFFYPKAD